MSLERRARACDSGRSGVDARSRENARRAVAPAPAGDADSRHLRRDPQGRIQSPAHMSRVVDAPYWDPGDASKTNRDTPTRVVLQRLRFLTGQQRIKQPFWCGLRCQFDKLEAPASNRLKLAPHCSELAHTSTVSIQFHFPPSFTNLLSQLGSCLISVFQSF